jgi:hypothetical protein
MLERLGQADRICGISALLALLSTYLPWYRFRDGDGAVTVNAFGVGFLGDTLFFSAIATLLILAVRLDLVRLERIAVNERHLLPVAGVALGAVVLQLLIGVNGSGAFRSITIGVIVALLSSIGMMLGARMQRQQQHHLGMHTLRRSSR